MVRASGLIRIHRHLYRSVPRIASFLCHFHGAAVVQFDLRVARHVQIHPKRVAALRVNVARDRRHEAGDVSRAAGHAEPRAALMLAGKSGGLQRILVEKCRAVQRNAGDQAVVKGALHHIDVFRVGVQQKQAVVPIIVAYRRAGFVVGGQIGQLIIGAECFARGARADAAGNIQFSARHVLPDPSSAWTYAVSPVSAATSAMPEYIYVARTA